MKRFLLTLLILCTTTAGTTYAAIPWQKVQEEQTVVDATTEQAKIYYAQNEIDQALKLLKSKGEETRTAEDWLIIGNILQDKDKIDEAIYMFKKAIEKDPKYYKAHYNLGYID